MSDAWIGRINGKLYNLQVTPDVESNPKSFYNSKEGLEIRRRSNEMLKNYGSKNSKKRE